MCEENPDRFELKQTFLIAFTGKGGDKDVNVNVLAAREKAEVWKSSLTDIFWHMRWSTKGLQPARPSVHTTKGFTLPPGRAVRLE